MSSITETKDSLAGIADQPPTTSGANSSDSHQTGFANVDDYRGNGNALEQPQPDTTPHSLQFLDLIETLGHSIFAHDQDLLLKHAEGIAAAASPHTEIERYIGLIQSTRVILHEDPDLDAKLVIAASNAISILNYGNLCQVLDFQFCRVRNWSYCRLPYANLNMAVLGVGTTFDGCDLSSASLFRTNMHGASFKNADLSHATTYAVKCLSAWDKNARVTAFSWAPDSKTFAYTIALEPKYVFIGFVESECEESVKVCLAADESEEFNISSLAFSHDGTLLACGDDTGNIRLCDLSSYHYICPFAERHSSEVLSLCFGHDRGALVSCSNCEIRVWDLRNDNRCVRTITQVEPSLVLLSPDDTHLAAVCTSTVVVWKLPALEVVAEFDWTSTATSIVCDGYTFLLEFSADSKQLFFADRWSRDVVQVWDLESNSQTVVRDGPRGRHVFGRLGDDIGHQTYPTCGCGAHFDTRELEDDPHSCLMSPPHKTEGKYSDYPLFAPNGQYLMTLHTFKLETDSSQFSSIEVYYMPMVWQISAAHWCYRMQQHMRSRKVINSPSYVSAVAISTSGKYLATGADVLHVWDAVSGRHLATLDENRASHFLPASHLKPNISRHTYVDSLEFSPDGSMLVEGYYGHLRLWNLQSQQCAHEWRCLDDRAFESRLAAVSAGELPPDEYLLLPRITARFSQDGQYIIVCGHVRNEINVFSATNYGVIKDCEVSDYQSQQPLKCAASNSRFIISAYPDQCGFRIWDSSTNEFRCIARGASRITCMSLSPDNTQLIIANGHAQIVQIWNLNLSALEKQYIRDDSKDASYEGDFLRLDRIIGASQSNDFCANLEGARMNDLLCAFIRKSLTHPFNVCRGSCVPFSDTSHDQDSWSTMWTNPTVKLNWAVNNPLYVSKTEHRQDAEPQACDDID